MAELDELASATTTMTNYIRKTNKLNKAFKTLL